MQTTRPLGQKWTQRSWPVQPLPTESTTRFSSRPVWSHSDTARGIKLPETTESRRLADVHEANRRQRPRRRNSTQGAHMRHALLDRAHGLGALGAYELWHNETGRQSTEAGFWVPASKNRRQCKGTDCVLRSIGEIGSQSSLIAGGSA